MRLIDLLNALGAKLKLRPEGEIAWAEIPFTRGVLRWDWEALIPWKDESPRNLPYLGLVSRIGYAKAFPEELGRQGYLPAIELCLFEFPNKEVDWAWLEKQIRERVAMYAEYQEHKAILEEILQELATKIK